MIASENREAWIGGSDAIRLYAKDMSLPTFSNWWKEKLGGDRKSLNNRHIWSGNIVEHYVLEHLGIPIAQRSVKVTTDGISGVNTDALLSDRVVEIKTMMAEEHHNITTGRHKLPKAYRAQALHAMVVTKTDRCDIHIFPMTPEEKRWPFKAILQIPRRLSCLTLYLSDYTDPDFSPENHKIRLAYFEQCFANGSQPNNQSLINFINNFKSISNGRNTVCPAETGSPGIGERRGEEPSKKVLAL